MTRSTIEGEYFKSVYRNPYFECNPAVLKRIVTPSAFQREKAVGLLREEHIFLIPKRASSPVIPDSNDIATDRRYYGILETEPDIQLLNSLCRKFPELVNNNFLTITLTYRRPFFTVPDAPGQTGGQQEDS